MYVRVSSFMVSVYVISQHIHIMSISQQFMLFNSFQSHLVFGTILRECFKEKLKVIKVIKHTTF
jgi:hypothetical protein